MIKVLTVIGGIILAIGFIILLGCFLFTIQYIFTYRLRKCKYCGGRLEFKGFREDDGSGHMLFHCPHCGAWEQVPLDPKEEVE